MLAWVHSSRPVAEAVAWLKRHFVRPAMDVLQLVHIELQNMRTRCGATSRIRLYPSALFQASFCLHVVGLQ